jgi:hypothetical protein
VKDPAAGLSALTAAAPGVDRAAAARELTAVTPAFTTAGRPFGALDPPTLRTWAAWEQRFGIVKTRPDVAQLFAPALSRATSG